MFLRLLVQWKNTRWPCVYLDEILCLATRLRVFKWTKIRLYNFWGILNSIFVCLNNYSMELHWFTPVKFWEYNLVNFSGLLWRESLNVFFAKSLSEAYITSIFCKVGPQVRPSPTPMKLGLDEIFHSDGLLS